MYDNVLYHTLFPLGALHGRKVANFLERRTMSLNVKDPEAHRLAQAIAQATGQSMTRVVTEALRERFARIERQKSKASVAELLTIADRAATHVKRPYVDHRSEEHTSELQSLMRISYAVFCLKKKKKIIQHYVILTIIR